MKTEKEGIKLAKNFGKDVLHWFEVTLGILVLAAVVVMTIVQLWYAASLDWTNIDTFLELLKIVLQLAIGIEVARLLFSYNLNTIIELGAFIIARKLLLLEDDFVSLLLGIIALVLLFGARHFFIGDDERCEELENK